MVFISLVFKYHKHHYIWHKSKASSRTMVSCLFINFHLQVESDFSLLTVIICCPKNFYDLNSSHFYNKYWIYWKSKWSGGQRLSCFPAPLTSSCGVKTSAHLIILLNVRASLFSLLSHLFPRHFLFLSYLRVYHNCSSLHFNVLWLSSEGHTVPYTNIFHLFNQC